MPVIQLSQTGFFGSTDNSNNPPCVIMVNNVVSTISLIGYDMAFNSMAGFTEGINMNKGTTISIQVKLINHLLVYKFKLRRYIIQKFIPLCIFVS